MSFIADKKREHEAAAEKALVDKDYENALFYTAKAAEFGLMLAEQSQGKIALRYIEDATELIEMAAEMKKRAQAQTKKKGSKGPSPLKEGDGGSGEGTSSQWQLKDKPKERLADVAGLAEVKEELREKVIEPFLHPELYERFQVKIGGGILMYGPPGNGKTFVARAIAGELDAAFFNVNASQIKNKYVGETEKNMQRLFEDARRHERTVLFLDEVDHLLARRGNRKVGTVAQFLSLTDGLVQGTNCLLVLGATNKPWALDEAVVRPGRLGTHIYVGPPDADAREAIISYCMKDVPVGAGVTFTDVAAKTEGYSGADMAEIADRAKRSALRRQLSGGLEESVTTEDFGEALKRVAPSITTEQIQQYEKWQASRASPAGNER